MASKAKLIVRNASVKDIAEIVELAGRVYKDIASYSADQIRAHINNFPDGQFVAVYQDKTVGYCATLRASEAKAMSPHTWLEITGNGYATTHNPKGEYLYGFEVCVDESYRGLRIGARLYQERRRLCQSLRLKGIAFGGRMPGLSKRIKNVESAEKYVELIKEKKIKDPVISFQMRNHFQVVGILNNYLPSDKESLGFACHMAWTNPDFAKENMLKGGLSKRALPDSVRVATVQYLQRKISSFEEFAQIVTYFVDVVADYRSDFVLFPELFSLQLLSIENQEVTPAEAIEKLTEYTPRIRDLFHDLAIKYNVNIIAGSHPTRIDDVVQNICYVCLRDGSIHEQAKIQPTPNERYWWNIEGGSTLSAIETDCGPIGVLICYDAEFPELARHLVNQGANILFIPFCTDERQAYLRVRYCAQARAVENQVYVAMAGNVGNLPRVHNMDIQYAQSCILTPCDFPFARDGIAADTSANLETVAFADLRLQSLFSARQSGTVQNLIDRRHDLYSMQWKGKE